MSHKHRVLNLISRIDLAAASPKKRAVITLLKWQPEACRIRFTTCHCKRKSLMLSFQTGFDYTRESGSEETCGYSCAGCDFVNAGSRPVKERES